jgi:TM2 domain-containing membrane protein YozV
MAEGTEGPNRIVAALLALFLGGFGVHKFYLGQTVPGIITIVACCGMGNVIGFIEGIIYLTKTDDEFHQIYVVDKKAWF